MGTCKYCERPAGFLKGKHKECFQKHAESKKNILSLLRSVAEKKPNPRAIYTEVAEQASLGFIKDEEKNILVIDGLEQAVELAFEDGVLTVEEEENISAVLEQFSLGQEEMDKNGAYSKLIKGAILRELMEGKVPEKINVQGQLPFNLLNTEKLIWVFQNVEYYETKTFKVRKGNYRGSRVRVAKGVYFNMKGSSGYTVEKQSNVHLDTGFLGVTDKHLYFAGGTKRFRLKYEKIMAFDPYSDGIGIQRDAMTAKPQIFITKDGWFTYNLIENASRL